MDAVLLAFLGGALYPSSQVSSSNSQSSGNAKILLPCCWCVDRPRVLDFCFLCRRTLMLVLLASTTLTAERTRRTKKMDKIRCCCIVRHTIRLPFLSMVVPFSFVSNFYQCHHYHHHHQGGEGTQVFEGAPIGFQKINGTLCNFVDWMHAPAPAPFE